MGQSSRYRCDMKKGANLSMDYVHDRRPKTPFFSPHKQPRALDVPQVSLNPLYRLFAFRRIMQKPVFAVLVVVSVALTVAVSFIVTVLISQQVYLLSKRVQKTALPFDAVAIFPDSESFQAFWRRKNYWGRNADLEMFSVVEVDSPVGPLTLIGTGQDIPKDTICFLYSLSPKSSQITSNLADENTMLGSLAVNDRSFVAWPKSNPAYRLEWNNIILKPVSDKALYGWACVNAETLLDVPDSRTGVQFRLKSRIVSSQSTAKEKIFREIERLSANYPGTMVVTPLTGKVVLEAQTKRSFAIWQMVSVFVLLASSVAISCVLTVSFLSRKRSFGIMRVLGTTTKEIRNMMLVEMAWVGVPGIVLGLATAMFLSEKITVFSGWSSGAVVFSCLMGMGTMLLGVWLPIHLMKNATCEQLLNNRPVYVFSNPSCANCGLCGGF